MNNPNPPTDRFARYGLNFRPLPGTITPLRTTLTALAMPRADLQREHCTNDFLVMNLSPQLETGPQFDQELERLWANFDPDF